MKNSIDVCKSKCIANVNELSKKSSLYSSIKHLIVSKHRQHIFQ